nr:helix-turn-helix transcriptional regulator [Dialister invisus]
MDNLSIGKRIKQSREDIEITRKELAKRIQVSASTITRYEQGTIQKIKMPIINSIANALSVNPMWIIGRSEFIRTSEMKKEWSTSNISLTRHEEEFIKKYRALSPAGKATVDAVIEVQYEVVSPKIKEKEETS